MYVLQPVDSKQRSSSRFRHAARALLIILQRSHFSAQKYGKKPLKSSSVQDLWLSTGRSGTLYL